MNEEDIIKIKIAPEVFQGKTEALSWMTRTSHKPGQPVIALYTIPGETSTDAVVAVGTSAGIGPGRYSLVSVSSLKTVAGIIRSESELPDSSTLVNAKTYVYIEPITGDLYWIYLNGEQRVVDPINPEMYYRIQVLGDNSEYWIHGGHIVGASDYYTREYIDSALSEISEEIPEAVGNLEERILGALRSITLGAGLDESGEYTDGIIGASSLNSADHILEGRLNQVSQTIIGLQNRLSDLEKEFMSDSEGLDRVTRLDLVYSWYKSETTKPKFSAEFRKISDAPLIQGTTVTLGCTYTWSYATWSGIKLGNEVRPFGRNGVPDGNVPEATYDWRFTWTIPETGESGTWEASTYPVGSGFSTVRYFLDPIPVESSIKISWPSPEWTKLNPTYTVTFEGSGIPVSWEGTEMLVRQGNSRVFQGSTDIGDNLKVYTGHVSPGTTVKATWQDMIETTEFYPSFWVTEGDAVSTEILDASPRAYIPSRETWSPVTTCSPGQSLFFVTPYDLSGIQVDFISPDTGDTPMGITEDWELGDPITYLGRRYQCLVFRQVGGGKFKFKFK